MFRRVLDQEVNVIGLAVQGEQLAPHRWKDLRPMPAEPIECADVEDLTPIFCDADQMNNQLGNAMPLKQGYRIWLGLGFVSNRARKSSFHPAFFNLPLIEPFDPSSLMALSAQRRSSAIFCGP